MSKLFPLLFLVLLSCSSIDVNHDFDQKIDYTQYREYDFFAPLDTRLGPLDTKRAVRAIDDILQSRGYKKVTGENLPQFYVNIKSEIIQEAPSGSVSLGVGGAGNQVGGGVGVGVPMGEPKVRQIIYLDLVDVKGDILFWQARIKTPLREDLTPQKRESKMYEMMEKALKAFPPEIKR